MEIFELAAALGKKLKEDARIKRLDAAREAYEADEKIVNLSMEYAVQQQALQTEAVKEDKDESLIESLNARVEEIYNEIVSLPAYLELEAAQNEVNDLMSSVNNTINAQMMGEEQSGCTHNCATCGGCH
ncbi:MAG: YlbF family regulator [Clostridia bacterium]|nr:YlbF family regulator [Clostridia bacterium]MBR3863057.1 YlbF family regulator [Clostridia bacterium]